MQRIGNVLAAPASEAMYSNRANARIGIDANCGAGSGQVDPLTDVFVRNRIMITLPVKMVVLRNQKAILPSNKFVAICR